MANHDLVIRNGTIVDGSGAEPYCGDIAIDGETITAIGRVSGSGSEEIDARGLIVTPGFVDVHTHYDGQITWENRLTPSTGHGVTTVVMGNCGVGFAPARPDDRQLMIKLMEGVEDIPEVVMAEGLAWNWTSFEDYLDALDKRRADADFAAQLPHSALRVYVMGERGAQLQPPTDADLAEMRRLTSAAVLAGALGVSTSRSLAHRFRNGDLAPSVKTEEQELMALAGGLADAGAGVFQIIPATEKDAAQEFELMERLVARAGTSLSFSLLQTAARPENWAVYLDRMSARAQDLPPIFGQFHPRPIGVLFGLDLSYHPFALNPSYRPLARLSLDERVRQMRDPQVRAQLLAEQPDDPNPFFVSVVQRNSNLYLLGDPPDYHQPIENSAASRAAAAGVTPLEIIYDDLLRDDGRAVLYAPSCGAIETYLERARTAFDNPGAVVSLGDGGAHYGLICDAAYPTYLLTQWVRGGDALRVSLPSAIHALSRKAALSVGLTDRGLLAPGLRADVNIIDIDKLHLNAPEIETTLPAGGRRLSQSASGYAATILRGEVTYRNGEATDALPGRLLRRGAFPRSKARAA